MLAFEEFPPGYLVVCSVGFPDLLLTDFAVLLLVVFVALVPAVLFH